MSHEFNAATVAYSNPQYASADGRYISVDLDHPTLGMVGFTASLDDSEQYGVDLYNRIVKESASIAPYPEEQPQQTGE